MAAQLPPTSEVVANNTHPTAELPASEDQANFTSSLDALEGTNQLEERVFCICKIDHSHYKCVGKYVTLVQCNPRCRTKCREKDVTFHACESEIELRWYPRLHLKLDTCQ